MNSATVQANEEEVLAEDIIRYGVTTVKRDTPVYQAIATLVEKQITGLPVVDDKMHIKGIITERDVMRLLYEKHTSAGIVEEFMTENVVSFDIKDRLSDVCKTLANNGFRRVTITHGKKLVSIISRADLIREQTRKFHQYDMTQKETVTAKDFMKQGLVTVSRDTSIYKAITLLAENKVTGLPVVDKDFKVEGIVTERDFLRLMHTPGFQPGPVEDYMTTDVKSFTRDDTLYDICDCLIENDFRRVPILDDGRLVGIVSRFDIIDTILRYNASLFKRRSTDA
ncbi:MAG: CBS domain-containing protein [Planctomycetes bacterium]|nr:CBS domain-containing protein [Planctomycetota bacterium]